MSHEIRTPLNSMMILAQMLAANEEKNLTATQEEWAATIHSAGRDLLSLINQILDLSKVEAGRIETHLDEIPIPTLEEFAERTFRPVALQRGLEFAVEIVPGTPQSAHTDRQLLEQILKNLLSNAFKFTEHGRVGLQIARAPAGLAYRSTVLQSAETVIAFAVSDSGIGIVPEQQEKIFEAFQQGDTSITRKYGGTGLGLTISREYARILGGEIAVQSAPGVGSTFTLYLPTLPAPEVVRAPAAARPPAIAAPLAPPEAPAAPAPEPPLTPEETRALRGNTVLIVEDDARNLYAATSLLERLKVTVIPASSAREAYARLRQNPDTDIALIDIMMPDIDGYQATREIRAMKEFATLPIIALTAKASASDRVQCIAAGCNDYLAKPVDTRHLVATVVRNLRPSRGEEDGGASD
jgi:CheY-like chemotaxis protein